MPSYRVEDTMAPVSPGGNGLQGGTAGGKQWSAQFGISVLHPPENSHPGVHVRELGRGVCKGVCARLIREVCKGVWAGVIRIEGISEKLQSKRANHMQEGWKGVPAGSRGAGRAGDRTGVLEGSQMHMEGTFAGADHLQHHLRSPPGVQPRLLVQETLLLHLFLLQQSPAHVAE